MKNKLVIIIVSKSLISLINDINYFIEHHYPQEKAIEILSRIIEVYYKNINRNIKIPKDIEYNKLISLIPKSTKERYKIFSKFRKSLIRKICENQGSNCFDYLDKMFPYIDKM